MQQQYEFLFVEPSERRSNMPPITLITDFGTKDHYVGAMKGVLLRIAPHAPIIDITHEVVAHNIVQAAFILRQTVEWYPPGTVHVVVVDPGVGSARRILAARYVGQILIAPDNGVISLVHRDLPIEEMVSVENTQYFLSAVSRTFHGRDIIAPVAAHVAGGLPLSRLGPVAERIAVLQSASPEWIAPAGWRGCVLYVDHFGNLVTNISGQDMARVLQRSIDVEVVVAGQSVGPIHGTYSDVDVGAPVALIGSAKMLEISINGGRASDLLEATVDSPVIVRPRGAD